MRFNLYREDEKESAFTVVSVAPKLKSVKVEGVWAKDADDAEKQCAISGYYPVAVFYGLHCAI